MEEGIIGSIIMFAGNFAPKNWALCNGATLPISSNTALFSILGTTYGGNGTTTFQLPDLQGRVPMGAGQAPGLSLYALGKKGGTPTVTMNQNQMPAHGHPGVASAIPIAENAGGNDKPANNLLATPSINIYATPDKANAKYGGLSAQTAPVGNAQPISIVQSYLSVYYVICQQGVYPQRG